MEPQLIEQGRKFMVGMNWYGKLTGEGWSAENPIGQLWTRFNTFWDAYAAALEPHVIRPEIGYEINIWNNRESEKTGRFYTFVGVEVDTLDFVLPLQLAAKVLPATTYTHLVARGQAITTWERAFYNEWLPDAGYKLAGWHDYHFQIQAYDERRFKGLGDLLAESEIDVFVPVIKT